MIVLWILLTLAAWNLVNFLYMTSSAVVGHRQGIKIQKVSVGWGPLGTAIKWQGSHWEWQWGPIPFGGSTKFLSATEKSQISREDSVEEPNPFLNDSNHDIDRCDRQSWLFQAPFTQFPQGAFQSASLTVRICAMLVGPLSALALGIVLLSIPVLLQSDQIRLTSAVESNVVPCAVGGLSFEEYRTTPDGQWKFLHSIGTEFFRKYVLFYPLEDWGGVIGSVITCGAAGGISIAAWMSSMGVLFVLLGVWNLIPLPTCVGGNIARSVIETIAGRPLREDRLLSVQLCSILVILIFTFRILAADGLWIWSLMK